MPRIVFVLVAFVTLTASAQAWRPLAPGVDYRNVQRGNLDVHITRIDMRHPDTIVIATDSRDRGVTVSEFAKRTHAIAAINGDYFDPRLNPIGKAGGACGLWGKSSKVTRNQGLVTVGRGRAEIQRNTQKVRSWMRGAVSGWPMLVEDCAAIRDLPGSDSFTRAPHVRTAVGISKDGRMLYFVVVDRATLPQLAELLAGEVGACSAMNLDGGGSTAMWAGNAIVNRPQNGAETKVGNHLAVVAASEYRGCERN